MLNRVDVHSLAEELRLEMRTTTKRGERKNISKRLKVVGVSAGPGLARKW